MTVNDFKLLATLPEEYEYAIFNHSNDLLILGKHYQSVIGFFLTKNKLIPIEFNEQPKPVHGLHGLD